MKNSYHSTTVPAIEAVTTLRRSVLLLASSVVGLATALIVLVQSSVIGVGVRAFAQFCGGVSSVPPTFLTRTLQSLSASPASRSEAMASRAWVTNGSGVPVD